VKEEKNMKRNNEIILIMKEKERKKIINEKNERMK